MADFDMDPDAVTQSVTLLRAAGEDFGSTWGRHKQALQAGQARLGSDQISQAFLARYGTEPRGRRGRQQPMTFAPAPQPAPPRRLRFVLLGLAVGLLLGAGGVGLAWLLSSPGDDDGAEGGAAADARAACEIIARTPVLDPEDDFAGYRRWAGASELAAAAGEADKSYAQLGEQLRKPLRVFQANATSETPEFEAAMTDAREACANL